VNCILVINVVGVMIYVNLWWLLVIVNEWSNA